jgi:hypothetical protein
LKEISAIAPLSNSDDVLLLVNQVAAHHMAIDL